MSCDGVFVVRRDGHDSYFYDRWAAQRMDRMLLAGPEAFVAWAEGLTRTRTPFMAAFVCGAVLVDLDREVLLHWAGASAWPETLQRYFQALLAARWPGYRVRAASEPVCEFAAALAVSPREVEEARARATLLEVEDDLFSHEWQGMLDSYSGRPGELAEWIAGVGEATVRDAAEYGCNAWVTVRGSDGGLYDQRCHSTMWDGLLRVGPRLVELAKIGGPRPEMLWPGIERDISETVFVDEARRTVHWWQADPEWMNPSGFCEPLWPGWTLVHDDRGTRGHIERSGRSLAQIRLPRDELLKELAEQLVRTMEARHDPLGVLGREAARLQAEHPGARVHVETAAIHGVPEGEAPPELLAQLGALVDRVDGF